MSTDQGFLRIMASIYYCIFHLNCEETFKKLRHYLPIRNAAPLLNLKKIQQMQQQGRKKALQYTPLISVDDERTFRI